MGNNGKKIEPPRTVLEYLMFLKYRLIISVLFGYSLMSFFGYHLTKDYVRDFFFLAILSGVDSYTTYFGLKHIPTSTEINPISREGFEKHGHFRTYLKGLAIIFLLLLMIYGYTLYYPKNIDIYSAGVFALYFMFGSQPFLNAKEIIPKLWVNMRKGRN
jgi:hypothetical protein